MTLSVAQCRDFADALVSDAATSAATRIRDSLRIMVDEDLIQLQKRWRVSFREFLAADASDIGEWQSTADLLDLANDKAELENRIVIGSALLVIGGEPDYAAYLLDVIEVDDGVMDVDAVTAKRALLSITGIEIPSSDWLTQVRDRLRGRPSA